MLQPKTTSVASIGGLHSCDTPGPLTSGKYSLWALEDIDEGSLGRTDGRTDVHNRKHPHQQHIYIY